MNNLYRFLIIIPFFILGCTPNIIEEDKVTKEINNLNVILELRNLPMTLPGSKF